MNLFQDIELIIINFLDKSSKFSLSWTIKYYRKLLPIEDINYISTCSKDGNLRLIRWAYNKGCPIGCNTQINAASNGYVKILKWCKKKEKLKKELDLVASFSGQISILEWLLQVKYDISFDNNTCAIEGCITYKLDMSREEYKEARRREKRQLKVIEWLSTEPDDHDIDLATEKGCVRILKYLSEKRHKHDIIRMSLECCQLRVLKAFWIETFREDCYELVISNEPENDIIRMMNWLKSKNILPKRIMYRKALEKDYLKVIKWLHSNGCQLNDEIFEYIIGNNRKSNYGEKGRFEVFLWFLDNEYVITPSICKSSLIGGNSLILLWLKNNGYTLENISQVAISKGNTKLLKFSILNGFPQTRDSCIYIIKYGDYDTFKILIENGFEIEPKFLELAVRYQDLEICKYLIQNGCSYNKDSLEKLASKKIWKSLQEIL